MRRHEALDVRVDYYAVLGVAPSASPDEITRAFRSRSKAWHPDVSEDADATVKFQGLVRAHDVLGDDHTRAAYDRMRSRVPIARHAGRLVARVAVRVDRLRSR